MASLPAQIEVPVRLDSAAFQDFSLFDVFRRRGQWRVPLLFAGIMTAFACLCFVQHGRAEQAILLGCVLLAVGWILPLVYFLNYLHSIKVQCKKMGLDQPHGKRVYTVVLSHTEVTRRTPTDPPQSVTLPYTDVYGAWRTKNAVYLYLDAGHAVLLPNGQANAKDETLWALLQACLPTGKCHEA